jgi:hypothetical protein
MRRSRPELGCSETEKERRIYGIIWQGKAVALGRNCVNVSMLLHTKSVKDYLGF